MKIVLVCFAGMSTSLLVNKMKKVAAERGLQVEIEAVSTADMRDSIGDAHVVLLGPQARYMLEELRAAVPSFVPVGVIEPKIYAAMDGNRVLDLAMSMLSR